MKEELFKWFSPSFTADVENALLLAPCRDIRVSIYISDFKKALITRKSRYGIIGISQMVYRAKG